MKTKIIIISLMIGLALTGVGYATWTHGFTVTANVTTYTYTIELLFDGHSRTWKDIVYTFEETLAIMGISDSALTLKNDGSAPSLVHGHFKLNTQITPINERIEPKENLTLHLPTMVRTLQSEHQELSSKLVDLESARAQITATQAKAFLADEEDSEIAEDIATEDKICLETLSQELSILDSEIQDIKNRMGEIESNSLEIKLEVKLFNQ